MQSIQGRNQVCSQRWARLPNFPPNFHFGTFQTNFSCFKNDKKKRSPLLIFISFPLPFQVFLLPCNIFPSFPSSFSIFPFFHAPLFPFLLSFPLPSRFSIFLPFFLISSFLPNFPQTFQGWETRPPRPLLVTPLNELPQNKIKTTYDFEKDYLLGKSRNKTFSKIEDLRFLQNYDDYNCIFDIKLKAISLSFIWRVMQWN